MYIETISVLQSVLEYTCIEDRNQVCNVLCVRVLCIVKRDLICTVFCVRSHVYCSRQKTSSELHSESESTCIVDRNQFCTYSVLECICIVNRDQICTVFCVGSHKCFRQKLVLYCTLSQSAHALKIETSSVLYSVLECMSILLRDLFCIVSCEANFFCSKICIVVIACRFCAVLKLLRIRAHLYCGQKQYLYSRRGTLPRVQEHMYCI